MPRVSDRRLIELDMLYTSPDCVPVSRAEGRDLAADIIGARKSLGMVTDQLDLLRVKIDAIAALCDKREDENRNAIGNRAFGGGLITAATVTTREIRDILEGGL